MVSSAPERTAASLQSFQDYFRCPHSLFALALSGALSEQSGYFRFGTETLYYGRCAGAAPLAEPGGVLPDVFPGASNSGKTIQLPFDPAEVVENLRLERYRHSAAASGGSSAAKQLVRQAYYAVRPLLPVSLRRHLQKIYLRGWDRLPFPRWPVDRTVEFLHEALMGLALRASGREHIPFIWFWPDGAQGCAIMTHDVETVRGRDFCERLMDLNDSLGIKSSFQVVPEERYEVSSAYLESIHSRGFEVNVHDFNHDGHLYSDREEFLRRAAKINHYAREFGAKGFRAGVMYRNLEWYDAFQFSYDMSVPNVAHLDPQRGGCCTVMPYFVGNILELPLTTTQDYPLFHILGDYSIALWKRQIGLILEKHGLLSFIVHPDYVVEDRARAVYASLLEYLAGLRANARVWLALPRDVDSWWRQRSQMQVLEDKLGWRIAGPGSERARIAYASLDGDRVVYDLPSSEHAANSTGALQ